MGESIQCWQCGTRMTLDELASNDGDCPRCEVEVHLAEYLDKALSKVATLEAENAKLRAELERRVAAWLPIETAPCDGRMALVYRPLARNSHDEPVAVKRLIGGNNHCWESTVPDGAAPTNPTDGGCHVTHWMPFPATPAAQAAAPSAPKADPVKVLPYWEPCNPGCDPEFNGQRSSECAGLCHNARAAIAAARQEGGKV